MPSSSSETRLDNASPLSEREILWRDRYNMLESHGYRLRQRYKPDWKPSWLTTKRSLVFHDDFKPHRSPVSIDAIRISDGRRVFLKQILKPSSELDIHSFLSDDNKLKDPRNHTVPLLDVFPDDSEPSYVYIVMPLLRPFDLPLFFSVDEVVEFVRQLLEGLVFMHKLDVAHRDCSDLNIMMDAEPMYPKGFHPKNTTTDTTGYRKAHPKRRRDVLSSVRYYFIDFGISTMFGPDETDKTVLGLEGQDNTVPELSERYPYDPFLVDIFIVGNLFDSALFKKYDNLAFLYPLIEEMTQPDPPHRCDAAGALNLFNEIISQESPRRLRWRLKAKSSGKLERFLIDVDSLSHEGVYLAKYAFTSTTKGILRLLRLR
ncbi:hypothetical protein ACEPAF_90 [Sanghuangporus sanghuang]